MVRGKVIKLETSAKMNAEVKIYKISYILVCSKPKTDQISSEDVFS